MRGVWRAVTAVCAGLVVAGAGTTPAAAESIVQQQVYCAEVGLPKPPTGPWVQHVKVCTVDAYVEVVEYPPDAACPTCVAVWSPYAGASFGQVGVEVTVDGQTTSAMVGQLSGIGGETPDRFCIVQTSPLFPIPCGGPLPIGP